MTFVYQLEKMADVLNEFKVLNSEHYKETEKYQDSLEYEPNFSLYLDIEDKGAIRLFTARTEEGDLAGYALWLVDFHPHYREILQGINNYLFVDEKYRGNSIAEQLFSVSEDHLEKEGVELLYFMAKADRPLEEMAEKLGYDKSEVAYSKHLTGEK